MPEGEEAVVVRVARRWDNGYLAMLKSEWHKALFHMRVEDCFPDIIMLRKTGGHRRFLNYGAKDFLLLS